MTATTKTTVAVDPVYDVMMSGDAEMLQLLRDEEPTSLHYYVWQWEDAYKQAADEIGVTVVFVMYDTPEAIERTPSVQSAWQDLQDRAAKIMRERG